MKNPITPVFLVLLAFCSAGCNPGDYSDSEIDAQVELTILKPDQTPLANTPIQVCAVLDYRAEGPYTNNEINPSWYLNYDDQPRDGLVDCRKLTTTSDGKVAGVFKFFVGDGPLALMSGARFIVDYPGGLTMVPADMTQLQAFDEAEDRILAENPHHLYRLQINQTIVTTPPEPALEKETCLSFSTYLVTGVNAYAVLLGAEDGKYYWLNPMNDDAAQAQKTIDEVLLANRNYKNAQTGVCYTGASVDFPLSVTNAKGVSVTMLFLHSVRFQ